jgi:hypothetical protein
MEHSVPKFRTKQGNQFCRQHQPPLCLLETLLLLFVCQSNSKRLLIIIEEYCCLSTVNLESMFDENADLISTDWWCESSFKSRVREYRPSCSRKCICCKWRPTLTHRHRLCRDCFGTDPSNSLGSCISQVKTRLHPTDPRFCRSVL